MKLHGKILFFYPLAIKQGQSYKGAGFRINFSGCAMFSLNLLRTQVDALFRGRDNL
jgi:hypothetical protein